MSSPANFIIIGAMKCATSTLHEQLAAQDGVFMTDPKEPCFFSDDEQWQRGTEWYRQLFSDAEHGDMCGESSTHYTKLPTYPQTIERMKKVLGDDVRFIYIMRHPIDRLVSQYIHEWSQGIISNGVTIDEAVEQHTELIDYGRYAYQLLPYIDTFGLESILPVFFERFVEQPQQELKRIGTFLGLSDAPTWIDDLGQRNVSAQRMRRDRVRDTILAVPGVRPLLRRVIPQETRHQVMRKWSMQQKPELLPATKKLLEAVYDDDLATLGAWLGLDINCSNYKHIASQKPATWKTLHARAAS